MSTKKAEESLMKQRIRELQDLETEVLVHSEEEKRKKQHARGRLTARERLDLLLDPGSFVEMDMLIDHLSGTAGDGIVTGYGSVNGRRIFVYSQDATVRGGSIGFNHGQKMYRVIEKALQMGVPIIGLNDSPGARMENMNEIEGLKRLGRHPLSQMVEKGRGAVFYPNTRASGAIPQISAIMGTCGGISVYSPALTDFIFMVDKTSHMFITGPRIVESVMGEKVTMDELGGAKVHATVSGVCDFRCKDERECIDGIKRLLSFLPDNYSVAPPVCDTGDDPERLNDEVSNIIPEDPYKPFDMHKIIESLVDNGDFFEVKKGFAQEMIVGFGRLDNRTVGIVANQPKVRAGSLTVDSSDKQARFIRFCDCFNIPLLLLVDTPAYMPGTSQEHAGIIRHGAKVLFALCEAVVPRVAVIFRKAYGGGSLGMGVVPGFGTDYTFIWPTAERGVLGAEQAVALYYQEELRSANDREAFLKEKVQEYRQTMANPIFEASSNLNIELIKPQETRKRIIRAFRSLRGKTVLRQPKHHGNIPL